VRRLSGTIFVSSPCTLNKVRFRNGNTVVKSVTESVTLVQDDAHSFLVFGGVFSIQNLEPSL
jgi:hypothetical protein